MIVGVLVELSNKNIDKIFDYSVPDNLKDKVKIGIRVSVPFSSQILEGFVLEIKVYVPIIVEASSILSPILSSIIYFKVLI